MRQPARSSITQGAARATLQRRSSALLTVGLLAVTGALAEDAIPIEDFFRPSEIRSLRLSPDGHHLSAIMAVDKADGAHNLAVMDIAAGEPRVITGYEDEWDVTWHRWTDDRMLLFSLHEGLDDERGTARLQGYYHLSLGGTDGLTVWANQGGETPRYGRLVHTPPAVSDKVLMRGRSFSDQHPDAYWVRLGDGRAGRAATNDGSVIAWFSDHAGRVRAALAMTSDDPYGMAEVRTRVDADSAWQTILRSPIDDVWVHGFSEDNRGLLVGHRRDDRAALWRLDAVGEASPVSLASDPQYDIGLSANAVRFDRGGRVLWVEYDAEKPRRVFFEEEWGEIQADIDRALPDTFNTIVDQDRSGATLLVRATGDRVPGDYYLFDRPSGDLRFLVAELDWLATDRLSRTVPVSFASRDGLTLHGYLTRPVGKASDSPLVLLVHDGPYRNRDRWGFDPQVQFLASRGYAVLQVNYRGSTGYGRAFERAGYGQWGRQMQDDLSDAAAWAVDTGLTAAGSICIAGAGYGGYAALLGASREPGRYRCAISYDGYTDLAALYRNDTGHRDTAPEAEQAYRWWQRYLGPQISERDRVLAPSPLDHVAGLEASVFVLRGRFHVRENEGAMPEFLRRVQLPEIHPQRERSYRSWFARRDSQFRDYVRALRKGGKSYETRDGKRELGAHRFEDTMVDLYGRIETFLEGQFPAAEDPPSTPAR